MEGENIFWYGMKSDVYVHICKDKALAYDTKQKKSRVSEDKHVIDLLRKTEEEESLGCVLIDMMLKDKEMGSILGGEGRFCTCSCAYANSKGSSSENNSAANYDLGPEGGYSTTGCDAYDTVAPGVTQYNSALAFLKE